MMGIIHVLDARVANQIAAGEVIERPSSAVKELVENALDAHSSNITVEIENGGVDLIKVTDDGEGFYKDDLPLAIERHATSKITDFNDVYRLNTFGFRGEALASIAVISRLKITSGKSNSEPAYVFSSDAGGMKDLTVAAPRRGTCIEVKDLYYNVPARKKFVKSNSHESALIYDLMCKFALGFPEINFTFINGSDVVFSSNQLNTVEDILHYIYGEPAEGEIIHFKNDEFYQKQTVEAWFLPTSVTRKNRNHMTYFVNERLIDSKELDQIIDEAVYTLVPKGRFLICVLKLTLPTFNIDVNIHPSKKIIKFKNIDEWKSTLINLLKEELWLSRLSVPFSVSPTDSNFCLQQQTAKKVVTPQKLNFAHKAAEEDRTTVSTIDNSTVNDVEEKISEASFSLQIAEPVVKYDKMPVVASNNSSNSEAIKAVADIKENKDDDIKDQTSLQQSNLPDLEYIGQLNQTFILAQDRENLYIIDQHTLHERILYEEFMKAFNQKKIVKQPLLHPVKIHVSPLQEAALIRHIFTLDKLGFTVERRDALSYEIVAVPVLLSSHNDLTLLFTDLLDDLQKDETINGLAQVNEERIIMASCKAAVKAHYKLTESEIRYLFEELSKLDNPHTCPHGRPIVMNISMNELYLFFKRGSF